MPSIVATCDYCGAQYDDVGVFDLEDLFGRCTECNNDVCKFCGDVENEIHPKCKELRDWEKEE